LTMKPNIVAERTLVQNCLFAADVITSDAKRQSDSTTVLAFLLEMLDESTHD